MRSSFLFIPFAIALAWFALSSMARAVSPPPDGGYPNGNTAEGDSVAKVNPDFVTRDDKGEIYSVRYEAVNAMLLNEFLKEHRKVQEQETMISQLKSTVATQEANTAQQQKEIQALALSVKEQASQMRKVSAQLARRVVNNQ